MTGLSVKINGIYIGEPKPFGDKPGLESAFIKESIDTATLEPGLLKGDRANNTKHHGGPDRVVHHYPSENFATWKQLYPEFADTFLPGTFGENITTEGMLEKDVCIGDIFTLGSCKLQITEGRGPCGFIDMRYGVPGMYKEVKKQTKMGWFYRVLEGGQFSVGDMLTLKERPYEWAGMVEVSNAVMNYDKDQPIIKRLRDCEALSERWMEKIIQWTTS